MNDTVNAIRNTVLGSELSQDELRTLADMMTLRELVDGDYLITEGEADDALHVILEGKLEVVKQTGAGETASLAVLRDGELVGELSFIDGSRHTVGLRALCDTRVLSLGRDRFESILDDNPRLVYKVMRSVARSAHRIVHRMNSEFVELSNYIFKQHGRY